jgi:membrane protease YdiL (CAAX protease family)
MEKKAIALTDETKTSHGLLNPLAFLDLALVLIILVGVKQSLLPYSQLYAGPASTLSAMIVATGLLHYRGLSWSGLGFRWPVNKWKTFLLTALTMILMIAAIAGGGWVADQLFEDIGTSGRFDHVEGNLFAYLGIMLIVWTHAAFFEELLFRAFIIGRSSAFLGGGVRADFLAVLFAGIFFGYRHYYYQGLHVALMITIVGWVLGLLYLWFGRANLLPLILAHGLIDTIGMTTRFLGIKD